MYGYAWVISARFRDKGLIYETLYKFIYLLLLFMEGLPLPTGLPQKSRGVASETSEILDAKLPIFYAF